MLIVMEYMERGSLSDVHYIIFHLLYLHICIVYILIILYTSCMPYICVCHVYERDSLSDVRYTILDLLYLRLYIEYTFQLYYIFRVCHMHDLYYECYMQERLIWGGYD